ncbi:hypothetical protein BXZ70DRAFT_891444 [Cristinia sonorae]|uniref:F-box domain-containing protein n=1 Tax=Cristinia sonorae TaxID=1940300 RepID=A0A8K0XQJ8_9AGAR|nr:hypothetical protein BXZ70DRAFT_891444 [Cristinia sonorae]
MSLLQDVLRTQTLDSLDKKLGSANTINERLSSLHIDRDRDDDEDELINVVSLPGSPGSKSRPASRPSSRASSPTRSSGRPIKGPLHLSSTAQRAPSDPLKAFPTEVSQKVFRRLGIKDLANCARVSRKWLKSQTLNYVWFQHYRKDNFHDTSLPPGKWTKRESKQNWRTTYLQTISTRSPKLGPMSSGLSSPRSQSGYQTPREVKEERWRSEAESALRPNKVEMREMYKELGGRKARGKGKVASVGAGGGSRDRGGWAEEGDGW